MKLSKLNPAWIVAVAVAILSWSEPTCLAESVDSPPATQVAMRGPSQSFDASKPPASDSIVLIEQEPQSIRRLASGAVLVDFGKVAFGNLKLFSPAEFDGPVKVRLGEKLLNGVIDRKPPGTVRFSEVDVQLTPGAVMIVAPLADERNSQQSREVGRRGNVTPPAVLTPPAWGVVTPFRWVEIEGLPGNLSPEQVVRRAAFPKHWNEDSASFACSDETLNRVWELCRYSIKATMFAGVYVDGDRERIPYEADAYLNQLSHYYVDHDPSMARQTFDWLMEYPTWPTEWGPHMVFMAHAEWMQNGDVEWISQRYESLKSKTLIERCRDSGLVHSNQEQIEWNDIVDWPPAERDGYIRSEVNTVINAFHLAAIEKMADLAAVVGAKEDVQRFKEHAQFTRQVFQNHLFDSATGLYRDGLGVNNYSQHANFFPLAFGLVEENDRQKITDWLCERGIKCSVYAAQYLLEGLFESGAGQCAVELMIAPDERSWRHMLEGDATITWEAWSDRIKTNLDWNHAWGAAPANLLPRYVLGARPASPGWTRAKIRPNPSGLRFARGIIPTPHGPISIDWQRKDSFRMELSLPAEMTASVHIPTAPNTKGVFVDGQHVEAELDGNYWILADDLSGDSLIELR